MISKRKKLSWIIMAVFLFGMILPGFSQPAQAGDTLTLEDLAPANGVTGVPVNVPLLITFTEEVGLGYEANVTVEQSADGVTYAPITGITVTPILVTGQPSHVISIIPNGNQWNPNKHCRVTLNPGAIVEVSNGLSTGVTNTLITANFQTGTTAAVGGGAVGGGSGGSGGTIPPTGGSGGVNPGVTNIVVVSTTPSESILMQNGTATAPAPTNIPTNLDFIGMQFSEAMNQSSVETPGNITLTYLDGSETVSVTGAAKYMCDCQYGDNPPPFVPYHAHFEPSEASQTLQLFDDTEYKLTLANLQSLAGVELSATSVSFTTVATSGGGTGMSIVLAQTDDLIAGQSIDLVVTGAQDSAGTKLSGIYSINLASTLQTLTTTTIGNVSFSEGAATITIPEGVITTLGTHTLTIPIRSGTDIITIGNVQVPIVSPASIDVNLSSAAMDYTGTSDIPAGIVLTAKDAYGNLISGYQFTGDVRVVNQNTAINEIYVVNRSQITGSTTLTDIPVTGINGLAYIPLVIPTTDIYDGLIFQFYLDDGTTKVSESNPPRYINSPQSSFHQALPVVRLSADAYQGIGPNYVVIKGQEAQVLIGVDLQGTAVPQDGFTFTLSGLSGGAYTITPVPLKTVSGGLVLSIDTTLLSSATHNLVVQANTGVGTVNSAPFSLQVINNSVNDVQAKFFTPTFTHEYLNDALEITKQGRVFIGYDGLITGNEKIYDQSTAPFRDLQVVSTDPSVVAVYPNQYGSFDIYAVKTGTANIEVLAPDNTTVLGQQVINVSIASDSPQISSIGVNPDTIPNNGSPINISAAANRTVGISIIGLFGEYGDGGWYDNNCSYSNTYTPAVGEVPGTYFLEASVSSGSDNISLITPFTIINDATKGELRGNIFNLEPMAAGPMDASGYMELYALDSGGQTPAIRQHVWSMTSDYVLSYITPGEYKVKFIPDNTTLYQSQWYPNASSFAAADTLSIQAGGSLQDINFFILAQSAPTISGTVKIGATPIPGIAVMAMDESDLSIRYFGQSDPTGAYSIDVPSGKQYIVVAFPGKDKLPYANAFYSSTGANSFDAATPVSPGTTINFALEPGGSISGVVKDENSQPIKDITVRCQQTAGGIWFDWEETDSSGQYTLAGLPYGTYTVFSPPANPDSKEFNDINWVQSQIEDIEINTADTIIKNLTLIAVDHPVVTNIWPKWIAADTTDGWMNLEGAGFNKLGEGKTLQLLVNGQSIAQSSEMYISSDGRWLSARLKSNSTAASGSSILLYPTVLLTDDTNIINTEFTEFIKCNNWVGITSEPLVYGDVNPWGITGQGSADFHLSGANLTSLGTEPFAVALVNEDDPLQSYAGLAQVNVIPNDGEYLDISFNNLVGLAAGYYYIAATPTIHGMVKNTVTDLSIWVEVTDTPAVTRVTPEQTSTGESTILVDGINFDQLTETDLSAMFTLQRETAIDPYVQPTVTILGDTQIQVVVPDGMPAGEKYDFTLVANAGTGTEEWIPRTFSFYLPVINGNAQFGIEGVLVKNEVQTGETWASEAFQVPVSSEGYHAPAEQLQAQIRGEFLTDPINLSLSIINEQLVLDVPAGLLRVGYYELVLQEKQTGNELDKRTLFIDNLNIPVIYNEHPEIFKTGITTFKVQFDGSTAIKKFTGYTVKLLNSSDTEIAADSEVNWDTEQGRYLEAVFTGLGNMDAGEYKLLIKDGSENPIECLNGSNLIQFTNLPFVYSEVDPWTVDGTSPFTIKIFGQNLMGLNSLSSLSLCDYNNNVVLTSASVSLGDNDEEDFLLATFNPGSTPLPEGWYTLKSNPTSEIDYLQSINLNVSYQPLVTGANIEYNDTLGPYQLVIKGINFSKISTYYSNTAGLKAHINRNGELLAEVPAVSANITDTTVTIPLTMAQLQNQMNGYYQVWLIAEQNDETEIWFDRNADFKIWTDPVWVTTSPNHRDPGYSATTITVTQQTQQAWKANETLKIQIFRLGVATAVAGLENLAPTTGTVNDTSFDFTLPGGLAQGIYRVAIYSGDRLIANSRIQIGGPGVTPSSMPLGYNAVNMKVYQVDSAFWQAGNDLTLYIKQSGGGTPTNFTEPINIGGTAVTATDFSFTLKTGLNSGDYYVLINRGNETLTGVPFKIIEHGPFNFTDSATAPDHVYFDGDPISFEFDTKTTYSTPVSVTSSGVWNETAYYVVDANNPSLKNVTAQMAAGKIIVSGYINNPGNNTLPTGCLGIEVAIPYYGTLRLVVIDQDSTMALVGIQLPEGIESDPALSEIPDSSNVTGFKIIKSGLGSIKFLDSIDLYNNAEQARSLASGIGIAWDAAEQKYHIAVDTTTMSFLAGKKATIEILGVPFTSKDNLVITTNAVGGVASNISLDTTNHVLKFDVNHFSEYMVYEATTTLSSEARLSDLKMNETTLSGFIADTYIYNVELPVGTTTVPTLSYTLYDSKASAVITAASVLPCSNTILVTAENGTQKSYTINFTVASESNDDHCFIATAAFGSKFQPSVALLRQFRDHFLMTNDLGQAFVAFYYKHSPPIAAFIAGNESLKAIVRGILTPVVGVVYLLFHPWLIYPLLLILLATMLLWRVKKKNIRLSS